MSNELAANEIYFDVEYTPSTIKIKNEDVLKSLIGEIVKKYTPLVFNETNIPEAKKTRVELNKYKGMLDDQRKNVKREYNKPLKEFEDKIKGYINQINEISDGIKIGLDEHESKQIAIRESKIFDLIGEMLESHGLENSDLKKLEMDKSWLTQTAFTKNGEPTKKTVEAVHGKLAYLGLMKQKTIEAKQSVREFAEISGLEPYAWENLIDQGYQTSDVIEKIKQALEQKKIDEEKKERQRIANEEYNTAMAKLEKEQQEMIDDKVIDVETGEIKQEIPQLISTTLELTGTFESLLKLKEFMNANNISYRKVGN